MAHTTLKNVCLQVAVFEAAVRELSLYRVIIAARARVLARALPPMPRLIAVSARCKYSPTGLPRLVPARLHHLCAPPESCVCGLHSAPREAGMERRNRVVSTE